MIDNSQPRTLCLALTAKVSHEPGLVRITSPTAEASFKGSSSSCERLYAELACLHDVDLSWLSVNRCQALIDTGVVVVSDGCADAHRLSSQWGYLECVGIDPVDALHALRDSHVAIIGVGGLGGEVARNLAMCGVGALTLIDEDRAAPENSNRQSFVGAHNYGLFKAQIVRDALMTTYPEIAIDIALRRVEVTDSIDSIVSSRCSSIVIAADSAGIERSLQDGCWSRGLASFSGGCSLQSARVGPIFSATHGICPECFYANMGDMFVSKRQGDVIPWSYAPLNSLVASCLSHEIIYYLLGRQGREYFYTVSLERNFDKASLPSCTHASPVRGVVS